MPLITRALLRAPLWPVRALGQPLLGDDELAEAALALAAPQLLEKEKPAARALDRYSRRAAFRPTPHGLFAGVGMARLGDETVIDTGAPRGRVVPSWARLEGLSRALLDDPRLRARVKLRVTPSLLRCGDRVAWLGPDVDVYEAELDDTLAAVLVAAARWASWSRVRAATGGADDAILGMLADGLLLADLGPSLIGPPPAEALARRLRAARAGDTADALEHIVALGERPTAARIARARAALAALPGDTPDATALTGTLLFPRARATLDRAVVERAAELAPVLFRLAAALAPPIAERELDPAVGDALDAVSEVFGAGAYDVGALALGGWGVPLAVPGQPVPPARALPPALLAAIVDRLAGGAAEVRFGLDELDALLPLSGIPDTFEMTLAPAPAGMPWLLGLHAPAGATWGRFAHALGKPMAAALAELARAEAAAGGPPRLDVAFAPSAELADLCAHPPVRRGALALTSWPEGQEAMPAGSLAVAAPAPLAVVHDGVVVTPSPLARVRSTTAPPGVWQLLVGWSLVRQHAPWAMPFGPLGELARTPRVVVDDFVVAPASWRIPAALDDASLAAWRAQGVPRRVQVGHEDELLPVDLDAPGAAGELASLSADRAWEIWPPLGSEVDAAGRRVEVVVAVVNDRHPDHPDADRPPLSGGPLVARESDNRWRTYKLFAAPDRQDSLLLGIIHPAVTAARDAGEIDGWFFQRYIDPPGPRHHLRLRIRARDPMAFERRLDAALAPAAAARDLVTVERTPYHRELPRWGGPAGADVADAIFALESDLYCAAAETVSDLDRLDLAVRAADALATGLGLRPAARRALAAACRAPLEPHAHPARDTDWRRRSRRLSDLLSGKRRERERDELTPLLARHQAAIGRLPRRRLPDGALPALIHLLAVRFLGPDRAAEAHAVYLWDRAAESLVARTRRR